MLFRRRILALSVSDWVQPTLAMLASSIVAFLFLKYHQNGNQQDSQCSNVLKYGRWSRDFEPNHPHLSWNPRGCLLRSFTPQEVAICLNEKPLIVTGDSSARQLFWAFARKLDKEQALHDYSIAHRHSNLSFAYMNATVTFYWDPFLNNTSIKTYTQRHTHYVIGTGLWHARHHRDDFVEHFTNSISQWTYNVSGMHQKLLLLPVLIPEKTRLSSDRAHTLSDTRIRALNSNLQNLSIKHEFDVFWSILLMMKNNPLTYEESGIHLISDVSAVEADVLLNRMCNPAQSVYKSKSTGYCCNKARSSTRVQTTLLSLALSSIIMWILFTIRGVFHWNLKDCARASSSTSGMNAIATFGAVCLLCFIADRTPIFEKSAKVVEPEAFTRVSMVPLLFGSLFSRRCISPSQSQSTLAARQPSILHRQQTEEWKGWMQIIILLYHYFGMSQIIWCYRIIRLLVASYLFLTGYGHTTYFLKTNDFSLRRVTSVLVRLNLLAWLLPFFMGTTYDFYYFPGLSSLWFLITWVTIGRTENKIDMKWACVRLLMSLILLTAILQYPKPLGIIFDFLRHIHMMDVNHHEFVFRVSLDCYVPYVGMLFALLYVKYFETMPERASSSQPSQDFLLISNIVISVTATSILIFYFLISIKFQDKHEFNRWHPITSPWPIIAYAMLRNAIPCLRNYYSRPFVWVGKCSLELFILQYHIWLAVDTKGLLRLAIIDTFPEDDQVTLKNRSFWLETLIITILFIWISSSVARATSVLTAWIVGPKAQVEAGLVEHKSQQLRCKTIFSQMMVWPQRLEIKVTIICGVLWLLNIGDRE